MSTSGGPRPGWEPRDYMLDRSARTNRWSLTVATTPYLGFPWTAVDKLIGRLIPGYFTVVGARGKCGKSTLMLETFDAWVSFGKRVLFLGTEQDSLVLGLLWAALRLGVPQAAVFNPSHPDHASLLYDVENEQPKLEGALLVSEPELTPETIRRWARYVYEREYDVLMLDHFHHITLPGNQQVWQGRGDAAVLLKNIAVKGDLVVVAAAQLTEGLGPLGHYEVPGTRSWAETAALRRVCDKAIQLWRPFRPTATGKQKKAAIDNPALLSKIIQPRTMCVRVDTDRYPEGRDPTAWGRLIVEPTGRLIPWVPTDEPEESEGRYDT